MKKHLVSVSKNDDSGAYQLHLFIKENIRISIGALGIQLFQTGEYVYTGSAMKNLSKRVERHLRKKKVKRWHIDYLTSHAKVKIISVEIFPSKMKEECIINQLTQISRNSAIAVKGFGSSDCRTCDAHLLFLG